MSHTVCCRGAPTTIVGAPHGPNERVAWRGARGDGGAAYFLLTSSSTLLMPEPFNVPKIFAWA
jgi:hypothetical protein